MTVNSSSTLPSATVYSYSIATTTGTSGYAANGNILAYTDSVNGSWSMADSSGISGYDGLNRLVAAVQTPISGAAQNWCWGYDSFGNMLTETTSPNGLSATHCPTTSTQTVQASSHVYSASNQISGDSAIQYDAAGNTTSDHSNSYLYDGEGRVCAVNNGLVMTQYIYNANGARDAKGTISSWSCDTTSNGFQVTNDYVLGQGGAQVAEMNINSGQPTWAHTNVYAGGMLVATYDPLGLHFQLTDWLGNRRVQTNAFGQVEETWANAPFGDYLTPYYPASSPSTADDATEHHFTGKERDVESGLDYFGARYVSSSIGRWINPDWSPGPVAIPYANLADPQTLNLYSYTWNNPLSRIDLGGHETQDGNGDDEDGGNENDDNPSCGASNCQITITIISSHPHRSIWGKVGNFFSGLFSGTIVHAQEIVGPEEVESEDNPLIPTIRPILPNEIWPRLPPETWNTLTEPGPLAHLPNVVSSFSGQQYSKFVIPEDGFGFNAYRVWGGPSTLEGGVNGTYYSPFPEVGGLQSLIDNAIMPQWNNGGVVPCVNLPPGTVTYVGVSAGQGGAFVGGNIQIYVPK